jgi:hypothetical protein
VGLVKKTPTPGRFFRSPAGRVSGGRGRDHAGVSLFSPESGGRQQDAARPCRACCADPRAGASPPGPRTGRRAVRTGGDVFAAIDPCVVYYYRLVLPMLQSELCTAHARVSLADWSEGASCNAAASIRCHTVSG